MRLQKIGGVDVDSCENGPVLKARDVVEFCFEVRAY
jgi:hypothetical protein